MQADSRPVYSNQKQIHPGLPRVLNRYLQRTYDAPIADYSLAAFDLLLQALEEHPRPLVLDSFCGTGHSTEILSRRYSDHLVVGVDKSAHRLRKHPLKSNGNYLLLHARCEDIWQLMLRSGLYPHFHYLLYPNPWPKPGHLQRRIHGNPSIRAVLDLGGQIELRSNWQLYVEEFGVALMLAGKTGTVRKVTADSPISLFERKYSASGHSLWSFTCEATG